MKPEFWTTVADNVQDWFAQVPIAHYESPKWQWGRDLFWLASFMTLMPLSIDGGNIAYTTSTDTNLMLSG